MEMPMPKSIAANSGETVLVARQRRMKNTITSRYCQTDFPNVTVSKYSHRIKAGRILFSICPPYPSRFTNSFCRLAFEMSKSYAAASALNAAGSPISRQTVFERPSVSLCTIL